MYTGGGDTRAIYAGPITGPVYDGDVPDDSPANSYRMKPMGGGGSSVGGVSGGVEGGGGDQSIPPGGGGLYGPESGGHDGL